MTDRTISLMEALISVRTLSAVSFLILLFALRFSTMRHCPQVQSFMEFYLLPHYFDLPNPFWRKHKGSLEYIQRPFLPPIQGSVTSLKHPDVIWREAGGGEWASAAQDILIRHSRFSQPASQRIKTFNSLTFWECTLVCLLAKSLVRKSIPRSCLCGTDRPETRNRQPGYEQSWQINSLYLICLIRTKTKMSKMTCCVLTST